MKKVPSVPKLLPMVRNKINFPWRLKSFNQLLIENRLQIEKTQSQRRELRDDTVIKLFQENRTVSVTWKRNYLA